MQATEVLVAAQVGAVSHGGPTLVAVETWASVRREIAPLSGFCGDRASLVLHVHASHREVRELARSII